jgi:hypothetical protein
MKSNAAIMAEGGRNASRARRAQLVLGKAGLPPAAERSRTGDRTAAVLGAGAAASAVPVTNIVAAPIGTETAAAAPANTPSTLGGREASRARRAALVQGKSGVQQVKAGTAATAAPLEAAADTPASAPAVGSLATNSRNIAQAMRTLRARNGRGDAAPTRPSGRVRNAQPIQYPAKVAVTETYAGRRVTGVRIGRDMNVTGDERGAAVQVTGSQYIGKETGFNPRAGGVKVGASRTAGGLAVTGTQVRSQVMITGDESNASIRITGEADQEIGDDLLHRRESGGYASMQFQRQHNPHGHTVFGTNLGRSARGVGSRERARERAIEQTDGGLPISGTALGRSPRVTGDEPGSCHAITGDQYLMPAGKQALCDTANAAPRARAGAAMGMNGRADPVTGEKVTVSESWTRSRITGVDVEHNTNVTGDEYGACSPITGTPYVGPGQYEAFCSTDDAGDAARLATPGVPAGQRVTGDRPLNTDYVTGTQRGAERAITGTPYYREDKCCETKGDAVSRLDSRFSVRSPQREAHLRMDVSVVEAPSAERRITGSFTAGEGKITGNQEFHFSPRARNEKLARSRVTGEGRVEGPAITGSAWTENARVTGTEDYIAAERNPSERAGKPGGFANSTVFKSKGKHEPARQNITGMVGWSAASAAKVTLSGGAQG